jgi:hypothetical protein
VTTSSSLNLNRIESIVLDSMSSRSHALFAGIAKAHTPGSVPLFGLKGAPFVLRHEQVVQKDI